MAELSDVQLSGVQLLWQKLENREFLDCIELSNKLCQAARAQSGVEAIKVQMACLFAGGDANFGLKRFERALDLYLQARELTEQHFGLLSEESMQALFRMERGLNAIAVIEGSADPKDVLTLTVLLNSQIGAETQVESELGDDEVKELWQERLEKKAKSKKAIAANPFALYVDDLARRLSSSSTEQFLMRIAVAACIIGGISLTFYAYQWFQSHRQSVDYLVKNDSRPNVSLTTKKQQQEKGIEFALPNSQKTVVLTSVGDAELIDQGSGKSRTLPVVIYDGSPLSRLSVLCTSWVRENLWVKWNGFALQSPNGMCYYDTAEPEYLLVKKMYALGGWAQDYFKRHNHYPSEESAQDELHYSNPLTRHGERVALVDSKFDVGTIQAFCSAASIAIHPGMIVCFRTGSSRDKFLIAAFDREGRVITTPGSTDGFLCLRPSKSLPRARSLDDANRAEGLIVLERPVDEFSLFLCQHGWVVAVGCLAIMLLLALVFVGGSKLGSTKAALKTARRRGKKKFEAAK